MKWQLNWAWAFTLSAGIAATAHGQEQSAHALAATGDTTADEALGRATGTFAWDGRLVWRAQRTQTVRLGGIELAWPLTSARGFPLALVPVGVVGHAPHIIGGAELYRVYDPSLPATFGGGVVDLAPGVLPLVPTLELALGTGLHTSTTFQDGWSYEGGDLDWLSFDDGTRALPDSVPSFGQPVPRGDQSLLASASDFSGTWQADRTTPPPDLAFSVRAGNRYPFSFGALLVHAALYLRDDWRSRDEISNEVVVPTLGEPPIIGDRLEVEQTTHAARLAAALRLRLEYGGGGQALELHTWLARGGDDRVRIAEGDDAAFAAATRTELYWQEQQLLTQQVLGEQRLGGEGAPTLRWHYALTLANEDAPDRRTYAVLTDEPAVPLAGAANRAFQTNSELVHDVGLDLDIPLLARTAQSLHLDFGGLAQAGSAEHERRTFSVQPSGASDATTIEELFAPDAAGETWDLDEGSGNAVDSTSTTIAGYGLLDGGFGAFSFRGGARVEHYATEIEGASSGLRALTLTRFDHLHVAPSLRLGVQPVPVLQVHAAWSLTVDRPRPLELLPSFSVVDEMSFVGDPELEASRAHNFELGAHVNAEPQQARGADGIGLTGSFTHIIHPIIRTATAAGEWRAINGEGSDLWWLEAEADKHFGFIAPWLTDAYGSIGLALPLASDESAIEGPFLGQGRSAGLDVPDFIVSARLAYDPERRGGKQGPVVAIAYQAVGERVTLVDRLGFDESLATLHLLDLHASYPLGLGFALSASARNLIDAPIELRYGDEVQARSRLGRSILLGVSFREPS